MNSQLSNLFSRALCLLAECSWYTPKRLQSEIEQLAEDTGKAGISVRVEHRDGVLIINPLTHPE